MEVPIRMACSECGRSVTWSAEGLVAGPSSCRICGGRISREESPRFGSTPASLQLTPDEIAPADWGLGPSVTDLQNLGRFQIREILGGGGFGQVYRAFDARLEREVALKVLRDARPPVRVIERFFREARAAAQLDHPHIVSLYDAGRDAGRCWIAYRYVAGTTLVRHMEAHRLDHLASAKIARALARALAHAHERGIFHRDLKPANVMIDALGRPHLTDFGLARRADLDPTMTRDGAVLGTPAYMPPEQASGNSHTADGRSDVYSLGVILYEMLCGQRPVEMPTEAPSWRISAPRKPVPPLRNRDRSIPKALDRICQKALAVSPEDRYASARSMADDLDAWLEAPSPRRSRVVVLAAMLLGAVAAREGIALAFAPAVGRTEWVAKRPAAAPAPKPVAIPAEPVAPAEPPSEPIRYIGNADKRKLHREGCADAERIAPANRDVFTSISLATRRLYSLCKHCLGPYRDPIEPRKAP